VPVNRLSVAETWQYLRDHGLEPPEDPSGIPLLLPHMPNYDDEVLGLQFFRTAVENQDLSNLSLPRTYFGRSELKLISFRNSDLRESRMCWNDWIKCDFTEADLKLSDLRGSVFLGCAFVETILANADLRRSRFAECVFRDAEMSGAKLTRQQARGMNLSRAQRDIIDWQEEDGEEPPGG